MLAIIGGTGFTELSHLTIEREENISTPYGEPSSPLLWGALHGTPLLFLARHGNNHTIAPHKINYRANLWALKEAGATQCIALASVGGIRADLTPVCLMVPHQLIDYTYGRVHTFYEDGQTEVIHIDFTHPYDSTLRTQLLEAAQAAGEPIFDGGVYAATQGPRLETAAEISRLARDGADIVGMTGMPETALAKELSLAYAPLCIIANYAAGCGSNTQSLEFAAIQKATKQASQRVYNILEELCRRFMTNKAQLSLHLNTF